MKISEIGEHKLLKLIKEWATKRDRRTILDIGDDSFVYSMQKNNIAITNDSLVEDVHFKMNWYTSGNLKFSQLGYKLLAINLSDLSACGVYKPLFCLLSLGLTENFQISHLMDFYTGLKKIADRLKIKIAGGNISASKKCFFSLTLTGEVNKGKIIGRNGARPGDIVLVSGKHGSSSAGLEILKSKNKNYIKTFNQLVKSHLYPKIRIKEAKKIVEMEIATALIDSSDGLYRSLMILCDDNNVGMEIYLEKIPFAPSLLKWAKIKRKNIFDYLLYGGEDYELVFTSPKNKSNLINKHLPSCKPIGEVVKSKELTLYLDGKMVEFQKNGFDHFSI